MTELTCPCILGTEFLNILDTQVVFVDSIITFENLTEPQLLQTTLPESAWKESNLTAKWRTDLLDLLIAYRTFCPGEAGLFHVILHATDIGDATPCKSVHNVMMSLNCRS